MIDRARDSGEGSALYGVRGLPAALAELCEREDRGELVINEDQAGQLDLEIARAETELRAARAAAGNEPLERSHRGKLISGEKQHHARRLFSEGFNAAQVARMVGIHQKTARRIREDFYGRSSCYSRCPGCGGLVAEVVPGIACLECHVEGQP